MISNRLSLSLQLRSNLLILLAGMVLLVAATPGLAIAEVGVMCDGHLATIVGTEGNDHLAGTEGDDIIALLGGGDFLHSRGGNDIVCSTGGGFQIWLGSGDDRLILEGEAGGGQAFGEGGDDYMSANFGMLDGGSGNDELIAQQPGMFLVGGLDDDVLRLLGKGKAKGGRGNDRIIGSAGPDEIHGGDGDDVLLGKAGDDFIDGGYGDDRLIGGRGADKLLGQHGVDILKGGAGGDSLLEVSENYEDSIDGAKIFGGSGNDKIRGGRLVGEVRGGRGADDIKASGLSNGNLTVGGGPGDDVIWVEDHNVTVFGDGGNDYIRAHVAQSMIDAGPGHDTLRYVARGPGVVVSLGSGHDRMWEQTMGNSAYGVVVKAGAGQDLILGTRHDDTIAGNLDGDFIDARAGVDIVDGGKGEDLLIGGAGADDISGGAGEDECLMARFDFTQEDHPDGIVFLVGRPDQGDLIRSCEDLSLEPGLWVYEGFTFISSEITAAYESVKVLTLPNWVYQTGKSLNLDSRDLNRGRGLGKRQKFSEDNIFRKSEFEPADGTDERSKRGRMIAVAERSGST